MKIVEGVFVRVFSVFFLKSNDRKGYGIFIEMRYYFIIYMLCVYNYIYIFTSALVIYIDLFIYCKKFCEEGVIF